MGMHELIHSLVISKGTENKFPQDAYLGEEEL